MIAYATASVPRRLTPSRSLTLDPSAEVDVELLTFVERYATNLTRWDLLVFFGQHPRAGDPVRRIAQRIGRSARGVEKELDDLAYLGILHARRNGKGRVYQLTRAPATRRMVKRFARCFASDCARVRQRDAHE